MSKPDRHDGYYDQIAHSLIADLMQWSYDADRVRGATARFNELVELTLNSRRPNPGGAAGHERNP